MVEDLTILTLHVMMLNMPWTTCATHFIIFENLKVKNGIR
jgi:hypothetical protein